MPCLIIKKLHYLLRKRSHRYVMVAALLVVFGSLYGSERFMISSHRPMQDHRDTATIPPNHQHVRATMFWVGEPPDADNAAITNVASSWTGNWVKAFGGTDSPDKRCGYAPCAFKPLENAFYFALPYNDYKGDGSLKATSELQRIPWYSGPAPAGMSLLKNRWINITFRGRTAYAQWEDVGPFNENDIDYVFGSKAPRARAGLDLSPATNDYLKLDGEGDVTWQFVEASDVPDGPWNITVTTSGLDYSE